MFIWCLNVCFLIFLTMIIVRYNVDIWMYLDFFCLCSQCPLKLWSLRFCDCLVRILHCNFHLILRFLFADQGDFDNIPLKISSYFANCLGSWSPSESTGNYSIVEVALFQKNQYESCFYHLFCKLTNKLDAINFYWYVLIL